MKYTKLELGVKYQIGKNQYIEAFETDHAIPSCGYIVKKEKRAVLISADTYSLDNIIKIINSRVDISSMVLECSFVSNMQKLAKESKHLTPKLLFDAISNIKRDDLELYINHIKPLFLSEIVAEIEEKKGNWTPKILKDGDIIKF
jgi:ribonuclease BN (tRNA processing enzyme)